MQERWIALGRIIEISQNGAVYTIANGSKRMLLSKTALSMWKGLSHFDVYEEWYAYFEQQFEKLNEEEPQERMNKIETQLKERSLTAKWTKQDLMNQGGQEWVIVKHGNVAISETEKFLAYNSAMTDGLIMPEEEFRLWSAAMNRSSVEELIVLLEKELGWEKEYTVEMLLLHTPEFVKVGLWSIENAERKEKFEE